MLNEFYGQHWMVHPYSFTSLPCVPCEVSAGVSVSRWVLIRSADSKKRTDYFNEGEEVPKTKGYDYVTLWIKSALYGKFGFQVELDPVLGKELKVGALCLGCRETLKGSQDIPIKLLQNYRSS